MDTSLQNPPKRFIFPPPPRLCQSISCSPCSYSLSDSSASDTNIKTKKFYRKRKGINELPPVGIFWDIENCQVPKSKSATNIVQKIRLLLYNDYREAEFVIVCDVKKESFQVIQDLNDAQVNLIHVQSTSKNAADEKLRQSLRRFAEIHKAPAAVVLISGDVNFAADLSDLRYRRKLHVILIHNSNVADALILCASETFNFTHITESIPSVMKTKGPGAPAELCISNIPVYSGLKSVKSRLKLLSDNCGGRVLEVNLETGCAIIRFSSIDIANRAQKRLDGEDVFGNKIRVTSHSNFRESPFKSYSGRKIRNQELLHQVQSANSSITAGYGQSLPSNYYPVGRNLWKGDLGQEATTFRPIRGASFSETSFQDGINMSKYSNDCSTKVLPQLPQPLELIISNIDSSIEFGDLRNILLNMLKQYALVLNLTITTQADGSPVANVKVGSQQEAQFAISQLHHQWLGSKRLSISYAQNSSDPERLRSIIISLLQEVPGNKMPLFKFFELVESRYHTSISLFEVNKLKDVCKISDGINGRTICLTPEATSTSPVSVTNSCVLYCTVHCPNGLDSRGWCEAEDVQLPNIRMPLKLFAKNVNDLLTCHLGHLPLLSFPICYAHEFNEPLPIDDTGVPLEHIVTCIGNIQLTCNDQNKNIKYLTTKISKKREKGKDDDPLMKSVSPSLVTNVTMLCREIVDLLKTTDSCQLLMSRFIPAYHHHFGRQCRVADYGFTRLIDLFEAISHIVQILGSGAKRTITLTHSAQIRRFTSDLLRVLKSQISKQLNIIEFPQTYEKVIGKPFDPVEYGLCSLEDLLDDIPENTVVITKVDNLVSIPKREQTAEEMQRTQVFATEVVELLRHVPYCSMLFNKFVPAYHHHFGRQCKVSDYGFTKLAELFEAIPKTVELEGSSDIDRRINLQRSLALKVLGSQIQALIKESKLSAILLEILPALYKRSYGYTLKPQPYECDNFEALVSELGDFIQVVHVSAGPLLVLTDINKETLNIRIWALLLNPPHVKTIMAIVHDYRLRFLDTLPLNKLEQMKDVVMISGNGTEMLVTLTDYYIKAAQIYHLLFANGGLIALHNLENLYVRKFGRKLSPSDYGAQNLQEFLKQLTFLLIFKGSRKITISLNKELLAYGVHLPPSITQQANQTNHEEAVYWPPPARHNLITNLNNKAPPKPDTPPALNGSSWNNKCAWSSPNNESNLNLSIPLSMIDFSKVFMDSEGLVSPTRGLLSAHNAHPMDLMMHKIHPPLPQEVPLPDKLISNDDCNDSGFNTSRIDFDNIETDFTGRPQSSGCLPRSNISKTFSTFSM